MRPSPETARIQNIERRNNLSYDEFARKYLKPLRPVILTDAIRDWKAMSRWTPEFFKSNYGSMVVTVEDRQYKMADFIDLVLKSNEQAPAPYLRNECISELFPELFADLKPEPPYFFPNWLMDRFYPEKMNRTLHRLSAHEIYIGGEGTKFPSLHFDGFHTHAFINHIYGRKEFIAYSPNQSGYMYPKTSLPNVSRLNDVEHPDLSKYPLFSQAVPIKFYLEPGETLFVPSGWWHTARILSPAISVSVNVANSSNWSDLRKDLCYLSKNRFIVPALAVYLSCYQVIKTMTGS
jgi:histone arginine demethylase JMJD6